MDLDDITAIMKLCGDNVHKLQDSLTSYQREVDHVREVLAERWVNVEKVDGRLIALHDQLLNSLSEINAYVIKLNLQIKLNRPGGGMLRESETPKEPPYRRDSIKLSGINAIEESGDQHKKDEKSPNQASVQQSAEDSGQQLVPIDLSSTQRCAAEEISNNTNRTSLVFSMHSSWVIEPTPEELKPKPRPEQQATTTPAQEKPSAKSTPIQKALPQTTAASLLPPATLPKFPLAARNRPLLPPKSGTEMSSDAIYEQILKNIAAFPANTVVTAIVMHLNIADNCFFVAKWDKGSQPLQKLIQGQVPLRELDQMPDYGDIFAVYDSSDPIITRVTVSATSVGGGYDAYLLDYGEHIHLSGNEVIFDLPDSIKQLPAEAIRCHLANHKLSKIKKNSYETVKLRVIDNNGIDIVADLLEEDTSSDQIRNVPKTGIPRDNTGKSPAAKPSSANLSEADMAMLNEIGTCTSDALKAVLGFRPKDEQRICRHYDPKINGCFKGNNCRLAHEPFAPLGATKDVEVAAALPEAVFDTPVPYKMGSTVRMLITFVNSPIELYAQFVDDAMAPLVWDNKDVPAHKCTFKRKPHVLDIVLAHYSDDCFYRAQIMDEQDGEYKIFYVDYGNTEFVYINSLAPCDDVDSLKPHRAVSCLMEGVIRMPDLCHQKTAECVEYLKAKLLNVELDVILRHRLPDGFLVGFTGEYADVPRQLVQRGYAQPSNGLQENSIVEVQPDGHSDADIDF